MSEVDILALARKVAGAAEPGEQVEAFVGQGTSTSVKAHGGEVESLTQATSAGIGVRVVRDGRQGFAWAGSLDDAVVAEVLAEARDNVVFAEPDEWVGLAEPDGVAAPDFDLWRDGLAGLPTERKIELALELEAAVKAGDPRVVGVRTSQWGDGYGEGAVATSTGLEAWGRSTSCQSFCVLGMPFPPTVPVHGTTHTPQADAPTPEAMPRPSELDHAHSEPGAWTTRPTPHQQRRREEPPATSGPAHSRSRGERHRGHRGAAQGPGQGPPPVPGLGSPGSFCVLDLPAETSFQVHRTDSQDRP
jgi:hypothetical protein